MYVISHCKFLLLARSYQFDLSLFVFDFFQSSPLDHRSYVTLAENTCVFSFHFCIWTCLTSGLLHTCLLLLLYFLVVVHRICRRLVNVCMAEWTNPLFASLRGRSCMLQTFKEYTYYMLLLLSSAKKRSVFDLVANVSWQRNIAHMS